MLATDDSGAIDFGGPATYRIVVQGILDESWGDRLAGLEIMTWQERTKMPRTILKGMLRDQAELNGVLETLYGLHMSILTVEKVKDDR